MGGWGSVDTVVSYGDGALDGEHVRLRPVMPEDLPALAAWCQDPGCAVLQKEALRPEPSEGLEAAFKRWSANESASQVGFSVVALDDDDLIGHIMMWGGDLPVRAANIAVLIGREYWGKGFGTDAVAVGTAYGFNELGFHRIGLEVWSYNTRAISAYKRVGYEEEGCRRDMVFHNGIYSDQIVMGLIEHRWRSLRMARDQRDG